MHSLSRLREYFRNLKVLSLVQYVKEGQNALLYLNHCYDTGHVPSAHSLRELEYTLIRVHKASNALQVRKSLTSKTDQILNSLYGFNRFFVSIAFDVVEAK